ncbi:MAG: hypothetical protein ACOY3Y_07220 [Acidobacteriota bacterium]
MLFTCRRCNAVGAVSLPTDDSTEVVCTACGQRQPRRDYEVQRLLTQLHKGAGSRPEAPAADAADGGSSGSSPLAGDRESDELARPGFSSRHPNMVAALGFVALSALGLLGLATVGIPVGRSPLINVPIILFGAGFAAAGLRVIVRPQGVQIAQNRGADAFGMTRWGPSEQLPSERAASMGTVYIVIGLAITALGVFFGALASGY